MMEPGAGIGREMGDGERADAQIDSFISRRDEQRRKSEPERETLPPWVYRQEYECSFEETDDQVFTLDTIERAVTDHVKPLFGVG